MLECFASSSRQGAGGKIEGEGIDVREDGLSAGAQNGAGGGEEAEGRRNNGLSEASGLRQASIADAGAGEGEPQGVRAAGAANGVGYGAGGGGGLLKRGHLRAEDKTLRAEDGFEGGHDFSAEAFKLAGEVEHGDGHAFRV